MRQLLAALIGLLILMPPCMGQLMTRQEGERQSAVLDPLKVRVAAETRPAERMVLFGDAMRAAEDSVETRRAVVEGAMKFPGEPLDLFLGAVLLGDSDAGLRILAANGLGKAGSEKSLAVLLQAAGQDKRTEMRSAGSDVRTTSSARRAALFAIAELAARFPELNAAATAGVKAVDLPAGFESERLDDVRIQVLYQLTHDKTLLAPFYERLKDKEATVRWDGVVAFQFLKLAKAPPEVVALLKDSDASVRSWTASVLAGIGDAETADVLMAAGADLSEDRNVRCNAIMAVGRMKLARTAAFAEGLLKDSDAAVRGNAAIALYRITGRRVAEFPEGFGAD